MTYCAAIRLKEGMIFASDTRTNAGVDHISTFRKLYQYGVEGERFMVLQTAGSLNTVSSMFDGAQMVGECMRNVMANAQRVANDNNSGTFTSSFLLGGQIKGQPPELYMIYPEGNCIRATKDTPFFQLGESKYGKPILDRSVKYDTNVNHAAQALMLSFDSTIHSNLSVGMPIDFVIYENDSLTLPKGRRIEEDDEYFKTISRQWSAALRNTLIELPECPNDYWG